MKFEDYFIANVIKKNLSLKGFRRPTDIQYKAIPSILKGEDLLAIAQTGTGKTAAFIIPILHLLLKKRKHKIGGRSPRCLIMVPTHELAKQIAQVFIELSRGTNVKILALYGGVEQDNQVNKLREGLDVLIATPGRMFDLRAQGHLDLEYVEWLILDEADHMLDLGFVGDIFDVLRYLPKRRQTLFFSATISEHIKKVAYKLVRKPIRIQISPKDTVSKNVEHMVCFVEMGNKRFYLQNLIGTHVEKKIMVFVRTKVRCERVSRYLTKQKIEVALLHGGMTQQLRQASLEKFISGQQKIIITTDVSARGIDVPNVSLVVNYDIPDRVEYYVHRVGRTGRANQRGMAISFCDDKEKPLLSRIEEYLGQSIQVLEISEKDHKSIVSLTEHNEDLNKLLAEIEFLKERERKKRKKRK